MNSRVLMASAALLCAATVLAPPAARADDAEARALSTGLLRPANAALQQALQQLRDDTVAQANPVGTPQRPLRRPALPQGFTYNLDASIAFPLDNPGFDAHAPGGVDAGIGYAFSRTNRVQLGYWEVQQAPVGFANRNVPFFIQGFTGPGTSLPQAQLFQNTGPVDVTTKDKIFTAVDQNLFVIHDIPLVISPTYLAHSAKIAALGQSDIQPFEFNGFPTVARARTEQEWILPLTLPFLATPRMFGTFTAAGQWLVHPAGVNQTNHVQLFMLGYLEYRANRQTTFFVQPSRLVQYDPVYPYPLYIPTVIYGLSHHFTKSTFVQMSVLTGGASNYADVGITSLTCQQIPCTNANTLPTIAGLRSSEVQIQFGIGSPTVVPL